VKFVDAQTVLLFGRQKLQFFLTLLLLRPEKIRETWDFRFFLPLFPPPKGETQISANIESFKTWLEHFRFLTIDNLAYFPLWRGIEGEDLFLNLVSL
jgi:hypothetical protein